MADSAIKAVHPTLGERHLYCDGDATLLEGRVGGLRVRDR